MDIAAAIRLAGSSPSSFAKFCMILVGIIIVYVPAFRPSKVPIVLCVSLC